MFFLSRKFLNILFSIILITSSSLYYYYSYHANTGIVDGTDPLSSYKYKSWAAYCTYHRLDCSQINFEEITILGDGFLYDNEAYYLFDKKMPYKNKEDQEKAYSNYLTQYTNSFKQRNWYKIDPKDIDEILDWDGKFAIINGVFHVVDSSYSISDNPIILSSYLFRNRTTIFSNSSVESPRLTSDVDFVNPRSFQMLDHHYKYAKDNKRAYYYLNPINNVDVASFQPFTQSSNFAHDNHSVFFRAVRIKGADLPSFQILSDFYSKDKNNLYLTYNILEDVDYESFRMSNSLNIKNNRYIQDKESILYADKRIPTADISSFIVLSDFYAIDKNNAFFEDKMIPNADPTSFVPFHDQYYDFAKDKNHLYKREMQVLIEDIQSFIFIDHIFAEDRNNYYCIPFMHPINDHSADNKAYRQAKQNEQSPKDIFQSNCKIPRKESNK